MTEQTPHPGGLAVPREPQQLPVGQPTPTGPAPTAPPGMQQAVVPRGPEGPVPGAPVQARPTKEIASLPPLEVLREEAPLSELTGEPVRPVSVVLAGLLFYGAATALAVVYGMHWWAAAHPDRYATSAHLIEWLDPEPGKWLSLLLEGLLAAFAVLAAGACGVAGFQSWNGWRWSRVAGLVAAGLAGGFMAVVNWWAGIALGLALVGAVLLWLPAAGRFFGQFIRFRRPGDRRYRRPETIFYGRLPRFR